MKRRYRSVYMSGHGHPASTKSLYLIFGATLIFGFVTGVIVFLKNNMGTEGGGALEAPTSGLTILAQKYGGCARSSGCSSYRILNDGTFEYVVQNGDAGGVRYGDIFSDKQFETLIASIEDVDFDAVKQIKFTGTCPSTYDGVAYRYNVQYEGEQYAFDSCVENLDGTLFQTLQNYFDVFASMYAIK